MSRDQARAMIDYSLAAIAAVVGIGALLVVINVFTVMVMAAPQLSKAILGIQSLITNIPGVFLLMTLGVVSLFFKRKHYKQLYFKPEKEAFFMIMPLLFTPLLLILVGIVLYLGD